MNSGELRGEIVGILHHFDCRADWFAEEIADALIAAGFVDKSDYASMKEAAVKYKAEVSKVESRAKEAEHRAARAERALRDELVQKAIRLGVTDIRLWYIQALNEAEKVLAEEQKND